jgi:site-specific recombinase XerD
MKATIKFFPNEAKKSAKTGKTPLYFRVITNGDKAEARIGDIRPDELAKWEPFTMRFADNQSPLNRLITLIQTRFDQLQYDQLLKGRMSAAKIRDSITGNSKDLSSLVTEYVDHYFKNTVLTNESLAWATKKGYKKAKNHLDSFLKHKSRLRLTLDELSIGIAMEFKDYLLGTNPKINKKAMQEQSAASIIKKLRTIFDRAVDEDLLERNPFHKVKLRNYSPQRPRLDIHQVMALYNLDLTQNETLAKYRDLFLFSVLTGLAHCDVIQLSYTNLTQTPNGLKIYLQRAKTDTETQQFLPAAAERLLEKYRESYEAKTLNKCFPGRSNKETNVQLKFLATMAGIPFPLSYHIARHTFRQMIAEAGIVETGVIKKLMGHSSRREIDGIYYQVTDSRLLEAKKKIDLFLKMYL